MHLTAGNVNSIDRISGLSVLWCRLMRFFRVAAMLHAAAAAGIAFFCHILPKALAAFAGGEPAELLWYTSLSAWSGTLPLAAELDARSRFQNYKRAKDLFYENGFRPRIADLYIHSRCQRTAARVAARDLGLAFRLDAYYRFRGYRWFHILPDFLFKRPALLFTGRYWRRTLLEPRYVSRHFLW